MPDKRLDMGAGDTVLDTAFLVIERICAPRDSMTHIGATSNARAPDAMVPDTSA